MLAADVVTAALAIGVVVLCVTTAVSALALPIPWHNRRRRAVLSLPVTERRVVTGPPVTAQPAYARSPAPRQPRDRSDVPTTELREAVSLVEHLLDHDPERLAELLTHWINDDERGSRGT